MKNEQRGRQPRGARAAVPPARVWGPLSTSHAPGSRRPRLWSLICTVRFVPVAFVIIVTAVPGSNAGVLSPAPVGGADASHGPPGPRLLEVVWSWACVPGLTHAPSLQSHRGMR